MNRKTWTKTGITVIAAALLLPASAGALPTASAAPASAVLAQKSVTMPTFNAKAPTFREASVHDPSVIKVGDTFYVFGSHLAAAKSTDLMNWDLIASGVTDSNPIIPNVKTELKEALEWAQSDTLWAADVIQLADGKFYMYYNACKGDSPRSAMGIAVADKIEGPYKDAGIFLKSGMWDEKSEDGTIYDATKHPNAVDPDVFFDKNGKLWMVYGSYSGGIFIMEMDAKTGKPLPGQGYGKKLIGGNHSRIEGPYMLYSPETDYYYMFLSFGGLDAVGGYNLRVVRSKTPDGPFLDAQGHDMANVKADPSKPLFDDDSIEPYGVKLIGNYLFERQLGDPGAGLGIGAVSPGHNSAYYDEETGKHFLIFHSRFPGRGEEHEIRVHEMAMNADGWPVVAPYRYAGEADSTAAVKASDVPGSYRWIAQTKEISADIVKDVSVTLKADGTLSGAVSGTWKLEGERNVTIQTGGKTYKGVFLHETNPESGEKTLTLSALSAEGTGVWGTKAANVTAKSIVSAVDKALSLSLSGDVYYDLTLPTSATQGTKISWSSSKPSVVSNTGAVTRPAAGKGDAKVTLTATIANGGAKKNKSFKLTVPEAAQSPLIASYDFEDASKNRLKDASPNGYNGTLENGASYAKNGKSGKAALLDGKDGYVNLPAAVTDASDYTFAAWVKWDGGANWQRVFDFGGGMDGYMFLTPSQGQGAQFTIHREGKDQSILTSSPLPTGKWVHVAVTLAGDTGTLYLDGKAAGTNAAMTYKPRDLRTSEAWLGKSRFAADPYFKGSLDEVRVYDKALSASEIAALAK
ncbi:LamG-like jellyroll fold domain-containing protein [Saccharibacillus alkalitolerans]|uniref:Family 43 glycosylhydrolase n=1 Tax=Saccharibacillus alkalitolerans TaxID=2705290 RepID=A0ABX0F5Y0_9BACL|nr:LamG-like jellyroll fold domain-containing protein [Saccharibacillus alkalitolerans]NGZ74954.1 family 43 glycosylhydrolase [Saccharibacillus alkalitolerans]